MIETYKIVSGKYQPDVAPTLYKSSVHVTRGNDMRLEKSRVKYDLRKFSFSNRVLNIWNSLPNWVVSANTTNTFKARLNKFWHNQDIIISKHICKEPKVVASVYMKNLSMYLNRKVIK